MKSIKQFQEEKKKEIAAAMPSDAPRLAIVQVGDNEASNRYIRNKKKDCEEVGICCEHYWFPEGISEDELGREVLCIQEFCDAIIVQLPLPDHIRKDRILSLINPKKDADGLMNNSLLVPATPKGIMMYLEDVGFEFEGKLALVVGRSDIVGKPMAKLLQDRNMTVCVAHSHTREKDLYQLAEMADLIIVAVGKAGFFDTSYCKENSIVVDVGINFDDEGKLVGDTSGASRGWVTPVPGGVGLLTRLALLENVIECATGNG